MSALQPGSQLEHAEATEEEPLGVCTHCHREAYAPIDSDGLLLCAICVDKRCPECAALLDPTPHFPCELKYSFCPKCGCLYCGPSISEIEVMDETERNAQRRRFARGRR